MKDLSELLSLATPLLERFQAGGFEVAVVGGALRDALLGREVTDLDLATAASPQEVLKLFPGSVPTGEAFGTVTIPLAGRAVHVTTYRKEGHYRDKRHPGEVTFGSDLAGDLIRRDFTVNAMALLPGGRLVDPSGGLSDLASGTLRAVGEPGVRFSEDALRRMRAIRFVAELGFHLARTTQEALLDGKEELLLVRPERVWPELRRLLEGPHADLALEKGLSLLQVVLPWTGRQTVDPLPREAVVRLARLAREDTAPQAAADTLITMGAGKEAARRLRFFLEKGQNPPPSHLVDLRRLATFVDKEELESLSALYGKPFDAALRVAQEEGHPLALALTGEDLLQRSGKKPGPWVGACLESLWQTVFEDPTQNRRDRLLTAVDGYLERLRQEGGEG